MSSFDFNTVPLGLPWCRQEDYDAFLAILEDPNYFPKTWEGFVRRFENAEDDFKKTGKIVARIYINPQTFPGWCRNNGHRINSESCYKFAATISVHEQRNAGGPW